MATARKTTATRALPSVRAVLRIVLAVAAWFAVLWGAWLVVYAAEGLSL